MDNIVARFRNSIDIPLGMRKKAIAEVWNTEIHKKTVAELPRCRDAENSFILSNIIIWEIFILPVVFELKGDPVITWFQKGNNTL